MTDFFGFGEERCNHCVISHKDPSKPRWFTLSNKLMRHSENIGMRGCSGHQTSREIKWHWKQFREWQGKIIRKKKKQEKAGRLKSK